MRPDRRHPARPSPTRSGRSTASTSTRRSATTRRRNSDLSIDPEERSIALYQAARYGLRLPRLRADVPAGHGRERCSTAARSRPTRSRSPTGTSLAAWKTYLRKYNQGRGVVLIGHSQGTFVLRELDPPGHRPEQEGRKLLVSAILLGGNVTVRDGQNIGGDFKNIPGCRKAKQFGCVIAFSTFDGPVPSDSMFGRPGIGPYASGLPTTGDVLCTNPAALGGGSALLTSVFPTEPFAPGTTIGLATEPSGRATPAGAPPRGSSPRPTTAPATPPTTHTSCRSAPSAVRRPCTQSPT